MGKKKKMKKAKTGPMGVTQIPMGASRIKARELMREMGIKLPKIKRNG